LTGDSLSARLQRSENVSAAEEASCGSLFLDGINHLEPAAQARLLQLLPDGSGMPPQGCHSMRVISSTTRNLEEEMRGGRFREELYYRINGVYLRLPPLRDRKEDIPALVEFFFKKYTSLFERPEPKVSESTMSLLLRHSWPGNIRELENVARKIVALGDQHLATHDLSVENGAKTPDPVPAAANIPRNGEAHTQSRSLKDAAKAASRVAERAMILNQLERTHWNRKRTARELQISYKALLYKLKQLGLDGSDRPEEH
jgi:two-component system response regulator AtoC